MLTAIARFEFRYLVRNPLVWLTAAVTFAAFVVGLGAGLELGSEGGLLVNAAYATLKNYLVVSIFYMFVTTAFVANAVVRDDETGFGPIVRSTRITRADYVIGRFAGAFAVAALCLLLLPVGLWLGASIADPATTGPNRLADHVYGYFLVALPNVFIHSAIFFALATVTRSMMATYLGVIGLVSGFFVLDTAFGDRPQLQTMIALADPFGARPLTDVARYWTVAERNVSLPDFAGVLLYNRLLWIGIALFALALAYVSFRFADSGIPKREQKKQRLAGQPAGTSASASVAQVAVLPAPVHGPASKRAMLWKRTWFEVKQVALSPSFVVLMAWMLLTTLITLLSQRDPDGKPTYPTTLSMIPELENGLGFVPLIIAIFYAGELVWRERSRRMHEIIDATPMPSWTYVVSKTFAMALVLVTILLATVVASAIVQLSLGYTELEVGKYLLWYVIPRAWDMVLLAALALFVQAVSPHKAIGWAVLVLFIAWMQLNTGIDHNLLNYGAASAVPLSDMNGAGDFWKAAWVFRVYWGSFALLMLLAAHLLWRRGSETRLRPRIAHAQRRLRGESGMVAAAALMTFVAAGGYAFYNTNFLNEYRTGRETEADAVEFEKKFGRYGDMAQPTIQHLQLEVALFPDDRRATAMGRYRLRNKTVEAIQEVHIRTFGDDLHLVSSRIAGGRLVSSDMKHRYHIFRLDQPMLPGDERVMDFETRYTLRGFRNQPTSTRLVDNGTFLNEVHLTPRLGAARAGLLQDPAKRRKYGLPQISPAPKLEDPTATARPAIGRGWGTTDITVSTSADQTPLAPGNKVSDVTREGRRIARFVSGAPVHTRFAIQSARYAEKHRQHAGVDLAVYYHPAHSWNVDRMLDALAAALDYYQASFGPYQFDHARIVEFPGYLDFAQAFGGTIPYSEEVGFVSDYTTPDAMDYVTYLTAHEFAHQYWAHQVAGADMEGRELLSETLSQYSAQMVLKKIRGKDHMRRYMQFELDRYLEGRANGLDEPPLIRVAGQDYVTYRKGALAMFLLQERMGEDAINRALRSLVDRYKFKGAPFPRSLDLVAALRAEATTDEDRNLITDLFERIPLYQLEVGEPTAVRRADGKWEVTVPVEAKKFYADGKGAEKETPLNERIEVGLFTALPGRDVFDAADVILLDRFPVRSGRQFFRFITDRKPSHAGVDPYNYYIDRSSADNVAEVR